VWVVVGTLVPGAADVVVVVLVVVVLVAVVSAAKLADANTAVTIAPNIQKAMAT
jgi:hypothetical protein